GFYQGNRKPTGGAILFPERDNIKAKKGVAFGHPLQFFIPNQFD
ncbi:MAG: hypothetical protein RIR17_1783, partial [Planctomycetota bacterium]